MKPKLSIIIPTGARPEAYALCERWIKRQTLQPDEIIVIDDGEVPTNVTLDATIILPEIKWHLGDNTQKRNLLIGLEEASGEAICIVEDDDWLAPNYLEVMYTELTNPRYKFEAVGELNSRYYNLKHRKWRILNNGSFAPLCQTIFRRSLIPTLRQVLAEGDTKFDVRFWKKLVCPRYLFPETKVTVGMKGMPGRPGLGIGHNAERSDWQQDTKELLYLSKWIGEEVSAYRELLNG